MAIGEEKTLDIGHGRVNINLFLGKDGQKTARFNIDVVVDVDVAVFGSTHQDDKLPVAGKINGTVDSDRVLSVENPGLAGWRESTFDKPTVPFHQI